MARNQAEPVAPAEQGPVGRSRKLIMLIGVGLLALLLSMAGLAYALLNSDAADKADAEPAVVRQAALYQPLEPAFTVNYAHAGRQRYMQVNVVLMGRDAEQMAALGNHLPLIRNQLVMLFGAEDFDALMTADGKESLREQATLAVQALMEKEFGNPVIESVLFTNLVLQ